MADDVNNLISKLQRSKSNYLRVQDQLANVHTVNGLFMVDGSGEATATIAFPIKFMERPLINFGGELNPNSTVTAGNFPTISVVVGSWTLEGPPEKRYFTGATLLVRTTGPDLQKMWIHWSAVGKAITNPYN